MKKHTYFYLIGLFILLFSTSHTFAKHIANGLLTYKQTFSNRYEINLTLYRDCYSGTDFDDKVAISIYNADLSFSDTAFVTLFISRGSILYVPSKVMYGDCLKNDVPPNTTICYEKTDYVKEITLPTNTKGYWVTYGRCCRSSAINNIINPGSTGIGLSLFIPPASLGQNSSPQFLYPLPNTLILGTTFRLPFTCQDINGDSLAYSFTTPDAAGDSINNQMPTTQLPLEKVTFLPPYTYSNPFNTNPTPILDEKTGILTVIPTKIGNFLFEITVSEYRNKVLLSSIRQQIMLNVMNNSIISALPNITMEGKVINDTLVFYANKGNQCFSFYITDGIVGANQHDSVYIQTSGDLFSGNVFGTQSYATLSTIKEKVPFYTNLCWNPTCEMSTNAGEIQLTMIDNDTCGGSKTVQKTYYVKVNNNFLSPSLTSFEAIIQSEKNILLSWIIDPNLPVTSAWKIERKGKTETTWQEIATISDPNVTTFLDNLPLNVLENAFCYRISTHFECLGEIQDYSKEVCTNAKDNAEIILSPNPLISTLPAHLELYGFEGQGAEVTIFDVLGQKMYAQYLENGQREVFFSTNTFFNWRTGLYFLKVRSENGKQQKALPFVLK